MEMKSKQIHDKHPSAKLTNEQVLEIRKLHKLGYKNKEIEKMFII